MRFPVIARKFPVPLKKFPVPSPREFAKIIEQCQHVTGELEARSGYFCKNTLFFPCLTGNSAETGSLQTACTANESAFSLSDLRPQPDRPKTPAISGFFARDMAGRVTGRDGYLP